MLTNKSPSDGETTQRFLVTCDGCSFERTADGRENAAAIGDDHRRETRHDVVALEVPPSLGAK
ncbi:hypothetical protein [Halopiger aswanensis]|uniref:Uncharacterized protein n=1 Tax=Halopiger aswanensis TaxID=148449 RepID=A0A3R7D9R3_9EURY|nr:hypothetical protein [Halopiger aswanensis]RKD94972.1 hypothetical protein ATJ93_1819 [Halopiger aswanensis]